MATPIPQNTAKFSLEEVLRVTGAGCDAPSDLKFEGVATDTREHLSGKLFVALKGGQFDGHRYVDAAVRAGVRAVLVEESVPAKVPVLRVPSTLTALGELAGAHRRRFEGPVIAVAGAAGKTTTRALTRSLMECVFPGSVLSTPGNLNNRVGVPMVLLGLEPRHRALVIEIGTNLPGEVRVLTQIAQPDVAILTLIDLEHTEGLVDLDGVEKEESAIFETAPRVAIGNGDDERVRRVLFRATAKQRVTYGFGGECDYRIDRLQLGDALRSEFAYTTPHGAFQLRVPWLPRPSALALMAAIAASESVAERSLSPSEVASVLESTAWQEPGRLTLVELADETLVLDDSYNANPASVRAAITTAAEMASHRGGRLHLVLGEMRELGTLAVEEHQRIGALLASVDYASLTAVSGAARWFIPDLRPGASLATTFDAGSARATTPASSPDDAEPNVTAPNLTQRGSFFDDSASAARSLLPRVAPRDVVLVKGSRGTRTDEVVAALIESRGGPRR